MQESNRRGARARLAAALAVVCALALALVAAPLAARAEATEVTGLATVTWDGDADAATYDSSTGVLTISGDGTLTVTADTTATVYVTSGTVEIVVSAGATLTQGSSSSSSAPYQSTVYVSLGASVTISGSGAIQNTSSTTGAAPIFNNGTCTISEVTVSNSGTWYTVLNHGTMTILSGTFTNRNGTGSSALVENGYYSYTNSDERIGYVEGTNAASPSLTICGGTFTSRVSAALKNDDNGVLVVYDANVTGLGSAEAITNWGTATIYGGTFTSSGSNVVSNSCDANNTYDGVCLNPGILTIYGGTFVGEDDTPILATLNTTAAAGTTTVYDGTFDGTLINNDCTSGTGEIDEDNLIVYHGYFFDDAVEGYVAATYTNDDGETVTTVAYVETVTEDGTTYNLVHALVPFDAAEATCTEDGNVAYYYCVHGDYSLATTTTTTDDDGTVTTTTTYAAADYDSDIVLAATGHVAGDEVVEDYVEATCEEDGSYDVVVYCDVCGAELSRETVTVPATGHTWSDTGTVTWSEDHSSATITVTCETCGEELTVEATVTSVTNDDGSVTYTATAAIDGTTYTGSLTVAAEAEEESETTEEATTAEESGSDDSDDASTSLPATGDDAPAGAALALAAGVVAVGAALLRRRLAA